MSENPGPAKPIPLWVGLYLTGIATILFAGIYGDAGKTTTRGWLATFSAALELAGVLLVASPELRPHVERSLAWLRNVGQLFGHAVMLRIRRLFGDRTQRIDLGTVVSASHAFPIEWERGFASPPAPNASLAEKVDYLLGQDQRFKDLFKLLENQAQRQVSEMRKELEQTASDLAEQTADSLRQLAEMELRMRLLGVACIVAGVILAYAANLA